MKSFKYDQIVDNARSCERSHEMMRKICDAIVEFESSRNSIWLVTTDLRKYVVVASSKTAALQLSGSWQLGNTKVEIEEINLDNEGLIISSRYYSEEEDGD